MTAAQIENELLEEELRDQIGGHKHKLNTLHNFLGEKLTYMERSRHFGQGNLRIGKSIDLENSIYDLAFVSQLKDKIMDSKFNFVTGELKEDENSITVEQVDDV